jgi:glucosamine-phosphate N-acetyltransferase
MASQSNINIRSITTSYDDYLAYTSLISQLSSQYKQYDHQVYINMINELDDYSLVYMVEIDNVIVGTIKIIIEKKFYNENCYAGHIEDVVIDREYRGKGYGKIAVNFAEQLCKQKGCYKILLYCSDHNVKFYEKCGLLIDGANLCKRLYH